MIVILALLLVLQMLGLVGGIVLAILGILVPVMAVVMMTMLLVSLIVTIFTMMRMGRQSQYERKKLSFEDEVSEEILEEIQNQKKLYNEALQVKSEASLQSQLGYNGVALTEADDALNINPEPTVSSSVLSQPFIASTITSQEEQKPPGNTQSFGQSTQ